MICVAIAGQTMPQMLAAVRKGRDKADVVELRLDGVKDLELEPLIEAARPRPIVATNRSSEEGGLFRGPEEERIEILSRALDLGADYIDIEWRTEARFRDRLLARKGESKVIFSYHDFRQTPSRRHLLNKLRAMRQGGADIAKIVTMAVSPDDNITLLSLFQEARQDHYPLIAFCMGEVGKISRLATLALGGYMTYAALGSGKETAPGQISADVLGRMARQLGIR